MVNVNKSIARYVVDNCPSRTDKVLTERFGISYNTFRVRDEMQPAD